ncbi:MAG: DNA-directed RNA polymerase [Candidatus Methanomarinus sp.]|jgi:DNA-directed RNA polymerase subunit E'|uniref:DNA-directed RNA polymerase n=1 Tax=Candidatus Methanomarinus sp. TaxID=3386244 RepID=A0AC61SAL3_9EURY|nr:MAG: DNA-directed RNA polymerase subunit E' [ANME-2 cluster archaeon]PPA79393.1 MAG: DNA-directed RNA polymerase subunit E' [ANME-2 cluster archaeon HR1]TKY91782.1 MAG: DNA-directed RNA polymerase [ANME-2 cluster archaeon]
MYKKLRLKDTVRIAPQHLGDDVTNAVRIGLIDKLEGQTDKKIGALVAIIDVVEIGEGHILAGDGAIYYDVIFDAVVYKPELQEIIEGSIVEIVEFGAFVGIGPMDGLIHVSQITDEFISYDPKNGRLVTKESHRSLSEGDHVRARIVAISINEQEPRDSKIGLTMRQHALGKFEWIHEDTTVQENKEEKGGK